MPRTKKNSRKQRKPRKGGGGVWYNPITWLTWGSSKEEQGVPPPSEVPAVQSSGVPPVQSSGVPPVPSSGGKSRKSRTSRKNHKKSVKGKSKK